MGEPSPVVRALTAGALVVVVGGVAVATAGAAGLLVATSSMAVTAMLVLALRTPGAPAPRRVPRPGPALDNAAFRDYRQVAEQLSWAAVSPRHYDMVTRPLLTRLATARLADRHRVDLHAQPAAARALLGEDVWCWVDPHRGIARDSQPPGVGQDVLALVVQRLESL